MDKNKNSGQYTENKVGQGFNDARGEIKDTRDIPAHNGLNVNNDPEHYRKKANTQKGEKKS